MRDAPLATTATRGATTEPMNGDPVMGALSVTSARHGLDPLAERLADLGAWLSDDLEALDAALDALSPPPTPPARGELAVRAAGHLLAQPGKRIRPLCVMLAARLGDRTFDAPVRHLAVAAELVHAATLLHDDVIDMGDERRGEPTARVIFGNSASILGGDHLLIEALRMVRQAGSLDLLDRLLAVISSMVAAEALQLERRHRFDPDPELYHRVIEGKTAALFKWALRAGGTIAGLDEPALDALERLGLAMGKAFQLVDDVLDLASDSAQTGKSPLADLREGKMTWPFIVGAQRDPDLAHTLGRWMMGDPDVTDDAAGALKLVQRLEACGAIDDTRQLARAQIDEAREALALLPPGRPRSAIEAVIEATVRRCR